jgi:hypothetical protein
VVWDGFSDKWYLSGDIREGREPARRALELENLEKANSKCLRKKGLGLREEQQRPVLPVHVGKAEG